MLAAGSLLYKSKLLGLVSQPGETIEGQAAIQEGAKRQSAERGGGSMLDERLWDEAGGGGGGWRGIYQLVGRNLCSLPLKQAVT